MSNDVLASLNDRDTAAFYRRLAMSVQKLIDASANGYGESLAKRLLLHWLDGGGKPVTYPARYVRDLPETRSYLKDTARQIFLSRRPLPRGPIVGIAPRIAGKIKGDPAGGPYPMSLEGNVEISVSNEAKFMAGISVEPAVLDILFALHGFTVKSDVVVSVAKQNGPNFSVAFDKWTCKAVDEYHWNPDKYLPVPNPDYGSKEEKAISPTSKWVTVYHKNAIRVERAGLAHAFHNESEPWDETDLTIVGPEYVRP